ncbi:hypothetical protein [Parapedobacter indicus]|uniref:Lipoprotein n=1 Tax=Parapedobacter indicus TaxID=1477437 RepID=A0A1I3SY30_9SPHI|nr:hypothetical protein [Parapedobacter indicus]PPK99682.1 hypothetical protein CLV26_11112 [Parapedobacter indicus]SFJ62326.1 hypothetical protein SAMN05444682_111187 [Parapedobacter indicus]
MKHQSLVITFFIFTSTALILGCKKNDDLQALTGTIVDTGSPALDGCGWLFQVDDTFYYPVNLNEQFQKNGITVSITFKTLNGEHYCFAPSGTPGHPKIQLRSITLK